MKTMIFVLYAYAGLQALNNAHGAGTLWVIGIFGALAWIGSKEDAATEREIEKRHEELREILLEIKLNQMP